ncbi:hypothetical protein QAD02_007673, partial [Eretmocerus hayati]
MDLANLNRLAANGGSLPTVKLNELVPGKRYRISDIREINTKYGSRVITDIDETTQGFLPKRIGELICNDDSLFTNMTQSITALKSIKPSRNSRVVIRSAVKGARGAIKAAGGRKKVKTPRVLLIPEKVVGFLPFLVPLSAGLSATGALAGGAAGVVKAINDAKSAQKQLGGNSRHNKAMEEIALGKGLYLKPYKTGLAQPHAKLVDLRRIEADGGESRYMDVNRLQDTQQSYEGRSKSNLVTLPYPLQYVYHLCRDLTTIDDSDIIYYSLQSLEILCLYGESLAVTIRDNQEFFESCLKEFIIK